jgi:hypothetical protein
MSIYRGVGGSGNATDDATIAEVSQLASQAATSAANAANSATSAASSASGASSSATSAANSASAAASSASNAASSASSAAGSVSLAASEADDAEASALAAAASASAASSSASSALSSANTAASARDAAEVYKDAAEAAETGAETAYANTLAIYGDTTDVAAAVAAASSSASAASSSASAAAGSASAASTSATNAANSAVAALDSQNAAAGSASAASATASNITALFNDLDAVNTAVELSEGYKNDAGASAVAAALSEDNAAISETNAANSATQAAASAASASAIVLGVSSGLPSIAPTLNLDFANTETLDPRITFTRASTATVYDGKTVAKAEENLLLRSQEFNETAWVKTDTTVSTNNAVAPDGSTTAETLTASAANGTTLQTVTAVAGDYTFSVWLRRVTGTGNIDISAHSGGTWATQSITSSWVRYTVTQTLTAGSQTPGIRIVASGDAIEVWGAQLEQRSSVTAYTPTTTQPITNYIPVLQTAAAGVARFDHNPVTGESLGLLIEEQRTNLLLRSEDFSTTWTNTNSIEQTDVVISPSGTQTADLLQADAATTNSAREFSQNVNGTVSVAHTFSVYAKARNSNFLALTLRNQAAAANACSAEFNLSTGTISRAATNNGNATGATASITNVGNGWYRCTVSGVADTSGTQFTLILNGRTTTNSVIVAANTELCYLWGAQLEAGAFATSYIPTVASQVTRSADAASMTGTNFSSWYRQDEGSFFAEWVAGARTTFINPFSAGSTVTNGGLINIRRGSTGNVGANVTDGTVIQANMAIITGASVAGTTYKGSLSYKVNDFAGVANGGTVLTDTSGTVPSTIGTLVIGNGWNNSSATPSSNEYLSGHIRKIAYYPIRCTNSQLQALTAV